jgi:cysteine desulfurase/selenocysteine lyase
VDYVRSVGFESFVPYEEHLLRYAAEQLKTVPGLRLVGTAAHKASVLSFVIDVPAMSALDVGTRLDAEGVAVRTGHHCCQPVMDRFNIPGTVRASLAMYNTREDVDALVAALHKAREGALRKRPAGASPAAPAGSLESLKFPDPSAPSPRAAADELAETFEFLGERDARNEYLLDLAAKLPPMPAFLKTEATRVHGCMSTVHLFGRKRQGTDDALDFLADSDAEIVKGLIAMLQRLYAGQRAADILAFDVEAFFRRIGLDQFITSQRRNGLAGMVQRIRALATALATDQ